MPHHLSPAVQRFQRIKKAEKFRAKAKAAHQAKIDAIDAIKAVNPKLSDAQAESILSRHLRLTQRA